MTISSVVHELVFAPGSSSHVWAATSLGVFESNDGGETWRKRMKGMTEVLMVISLAIDPQQPQTLYAGTSGGVYKSVDGAKNWDKVNTGLVAADVLKSSRSLGVTRIKVDPFNPDRVYIATLEGLFYTGNAGASWSRIGESLPDHMLSELLLDSQKAGVMYVGHREGVSRSDDSGETWETRNMGLTNINIRTIGMSPLDSHVLYAGTNGKGLFRSVDSGVSWKSVPLGIQGNAS